MKKRDLITLDDLDAREIRKTLKLASRLKKNPLSRKNSFTGRTFGLLFQKPSNRTRISFEVGITHLGGYALYLSPDEIRMGEREPVKDVACVISRYVDGMIARVFSHEDIEMLAKYSRVPVVNGLSDIAHPCQALSDIFTVMEHKGRLDRVTMSYVGDGNNVVNSLMLACAKTGMHFKVATPEEYPPDKRVVERAGKEAEKTRGKLEIFTDPRKAVSNSDIVYTDVWVSMGEEKSRREKLSAFSGFQVNRELMKYAREDALLMHCLPAHRGEEVTDIIDSKRAIVYDQAENRMHVQKAALLRLMR